MEGRVGGLPEEVLFIFVFEAREKSFAHSSMSRTTFSGGIFLRPLSPPILCEGEQYPRYNTLRAILDRWTARNIERETGGALAPEPV
eukprot:1113345-Amorphochlora_amoeboformis.AAC.1